MTDSSNQNRGKYGGRFISNKEPLAAATKQKRSRRPDEETLSKQVEAPVSHTMYHIVEASDSSKLTLRQMDPFASAAAYQEFRQWTYDFLELRDPRCPMAMPQDAAWSLASHWKLQRSVGRQGGWE